MSYPYQDIIALESGSAFTTIVLDFLDKRKSEILQNQLSLMLQNNEYCYVKRGEGAPLNDQQCEEIKQILNTRIVEERSLLNTKYHFNFAIFINIKDVSKEWLETAQSFLHRMKKVLAAPTLLLYPYLCVCKDNQNSIHDMEMFDVCANALLESSDVEQPRLILIDALPLSEPETWLRATARALNVLSRDNVLATSLRGKDQTIWNWTMTEFDVQAKDEEIRKRKKLEEILSGNGEFPRAKLERNLRSLVTSFMQENQSDLRLSADNIPIPSDVIGGFLRKRALQDNIPAFAKSIEATFYENVTKKLIERIKAADKAIWCTILLDGIPLNQWESVSEQLQRINLTEGRSLSASPENFPQRKVNLMVQANVEDMRTAISGELSRCTQEVKEYLPEYIKLTIEQALPAFIEKNLTKEREQVREKLRSLGMTNIVADDAQDYLRRLDELNHQMMAVSFSNVYDQSVYVLISDDTYNLWQEEYQSSLNVPGCSVYNYHSLEEFEFQTLTLTTWRYQEYLKNREYFFKQN